MTTGMIINVTTTITSSNNMHINNKNNNRIDSLALWSCLDVCDPSAQCCQQCCNCCMCCLQCCNCLMCCPAMLQLPYVLSGCLAAAADNAGQNLNIWLNRLNTFSLRHHASKPSHTWIIFIEAALASLDFKEPTLKSATHDAPRTMNICMPLTLAVMFCMLLQSECYVFSWKSGAYWDIFCSLMLTLFNGFFREQNYVFILTCISGFGSNVLFLFSAYCICEGLQIPRQTRCDHVCFTHGMSLIRRYEWQTQIDHFCIIHGLSVLRRYEAQTCCHHMASQWIFWID